MFENILFQDRAIHQLVSALKTGSVAPGWLVFGPSGSGKLTLALEFARILTCRGQPRGDWNCECPSCQAHRLLDYPGLALGGFKDFLGEITVSADALERKKDTPRAYHFYRAVKKVLKRLEPMFWDPTDNKYKALLEVGRSVAEALDDYHPRYRGERVNAKSLAAIVKGCEKIRNQFPQQGLGVEGVRELSTWARTTSALGIRVIILEGADRWLASTRNALLKILEEPPQEVYFLVLTRHRAAVIPTIQSRLRPLELRARTTEEQATVAQRIFALDGVTDLSGLLSGGGRKSEVERAVASFLQAVARRERRLPDLGLEETDFHAFLELLASSLSVTARDGGLEQRESSIRRLEVLRKAVVSKEIYHLDLPVVLDELFFSFCEVA